MDLLLDHTIISSPVPVGGFPDSYYADTAFTILTLDNNSLYQFTPKYIDWREYPVLLLTLLTK